MDFLQESYVSRRASPHGVNHLKRLQINIVVSFSIVLNKFYCIKCTTLQISSVGLQLHPLQTLRPLPPSARRVRRCFCDGCRFRFHGRVWFPFANTISHNLRDILDGRINLVVLEVDPNRALHVIISVLSVLLVFYRYYLIAFH